MMGGQTWPHTFVFVDHTNTSLSIVLLNSNQGYYVAFVSSNELSYFLSVGTLLFLDVSSFFFDVSICVMTQNKSQIWATLHISLHFQLYRTFGGDGFCSSRPIIFSFHDMYIQPSSVFTILSHVLITLAFLSYFFLKIIFALTFLEKDRFYSFLI